MNFENNNTNTINYLINILIFLMLYLLTSSCIGRRKINICNCPEPIDYSKEFQSNLVKDLEKIDSYYINQVIIDWFNINKELQECYE